MAKREQNPPLLACRSGVLTSFSTQAACSRDTDDDGFSAHRRTAQPSVFAVIALKVSIGLVTKPYVFGAEYVASREERNSFSHRDISLFLRFVPIRNDPEMVVNLGLLFAEAGLRRLGVAA